MENNGAIENVSIGIIILSGLVITSMLIIDLIENGIMQFQSIIMYTNAYGLLLVIFSVIKEKQNNVN